MIAERWYAALLLTFLVGFLIGDLSRRAVEAEKARQRRRTLRQVERSLSRATHSRIGQEYR
jgi:hypothetical protein